MYRVPHVKYPLYLSDFMKLEVSRKIFEESSNIKFHENPSSGSRVVLCDRTDRRTDRQTRRIYNNFKRYIAGQMLHVNGLRY
jgi:hypothetical protein